MPTPSSPPDAPDRRDTAGQLLAGFLTGLLLVVPLRIALQTTSYGGLYGAVFSGALIVVVLGLVLRMIGVRQALGLTTLVAGVFAVAVLVVLAVLAALGDPGGHTSVALFAGVVAAALAAPVVAATLRAAKDETGALLLGGAVGVVGLLIAAGAAPEVGDRLDEARDDAAKIQALEASGLTPYLPEIEDTRGEFSSTTSTRSENGATRLTAYTIDYEQESVGDPDFDAASISVEFGFVEGPACEEIVDDLACVQGDGYVITEREGTADQVSADRGGIRLVATFREGTGTLPDAATVGRALAEADEVDWQQVLDTDD